MPLLQMPMVPLSFLVAAVFVAYSFTALRSDRKTSPLQLSFIALVFVSALQSILIGLRWGYGILSVSYVMPIVGSMIPALIYFSLTKLLRKNGHSPVYSAIPTTLITICVIFYREPIDLLLILIVISYAGRIIYFLVPGEDAFIHFPLEGVSFIHRSILFSTLILCLSAVIDTIVMLNFMFAEGKQAPVLIVFGHTLILAMLGAVGAAASRGSSLALPPIDDDPTSQEEGKFAVEAPLKQEAECETVDVSEGHEEIIERLSTLMEERKVYREPSLNLNRLARKVVAPERQVSQAINQATGMNVSQYVNGYRIAEACQLLESTNKSVTEILLDVGFQTKSNFHREFRRITDMPPQMWRSRANVVAAEA
ncbi:HTH-type transcriptional activator RhaR [Pseudovibrio sp. W64]|uniref:helix-turn-helix domain-containing protein n=1 Tax=Pseudovibrio TaxID=258255 RepID=UPI0007B204CC|nr:AraC family transcriptional regulator [Pseudovibrio sp. W64]KZK87658.1 HTH-type transcriptional activator RhaR [Pseudovibrio sp. W64]